MSVVTNAILSLGVAGKPILPLVNKYFEPANGFVLVDDERLPDGWYGGNKYLECELAIGAFDYLDLDDFIRHLRTLLWPFPGLVQLIVRE